MSVAQHVFFRGVEAACLLVFTLDFFLLFQDSLYRIGFGKWLWRDCDAQR